MNKERLMRVVFYMLPSEGQKIKNMVNKEKIKDDSASRVVRRKFGFIK